MMGEDRKDLRGTLGGVLFIVVGAVCWWDVSDVPSPQAVVFPRAVIGLMVAFSAILIVRNLLGFATSEYTPQSGSMLRRVALLVAMVAGTFAMNWIGFTIAALLVYLALMALAMYERWTPTRCLVYPLAGVVLVLGFHFIFKGLFQVPLPEPRWFTLPF